MENTDIRKITLKDGRTYSIRLDRRRVFYPSEWIKFYSAIKIKNHPLFDFMFNTGARFDEAIHIRPIDFDFDRKTVRLWKTKTKAIKGETHGKPRTISLSTEYTKRVKKVCKDKPLNEPIYKFTIQGMNQLMKRTLDRLGIRDYYNFSSHNIRKTHGMYLKALDIGIEEICTRLGHDYDTYISHYGSAEIFSDKDFVLIKQLLGDLYMRKRRF